MEACGFGVGVWMEPAVRWYVCCFRMGGISLSTPLRNLMWMSFSDGSVERVRWFSVFVHVKISIIVWV